MRRFISSIIESESLCYIIGTICIALFGFTTIIGIDLYYNDHYPTHYYVDDDDICYASEFAKRSILADAVQAVFCLSEEIFYINRRIPNDEYGHCAVTAVAFGLLANQRAAKYFGVKSSHFFELLKKDEGEQGFNWETMYGGQYSIYLESAKILEDIFDKTKPSSELNNICMFLNMDEDSEQRLEKAGFEFPDQDNVFDRVFIIIHDIIRNMYEIRYGDLDLFEKHFPFIEIRDAFSFKFTEDNIPNKAMIIQPSPYDKDMVFGHESYPLTHVPHIKLQSFFMIVAADSYYGNIDYYYKLHGLEPKSENAHLVITIPTMRWRYHCIAMVKSTSNKEWIARDDDRPAKTYFTEDPNEAFNQHKETLLRRQSTIQQRLLSEFKHIPELEQQFAATQMNIRPSGPFIAIRGDDFQKMPWAEQEITL